jgi:excisionase family DNA binding protein
MSITDLELIEPFVVRPRTACRLLDCGVTRLYDLIAQGELESFLDGGSRKIVVTSIKAYLDRQREAAKSERLPRKTAAATTASLTSRRISAPTTEAR